MSIGIRVPSQWQFGQRKPVEEARPGTFRRAVMAAVQRHLFAGRGLDYESGRQRFEKRWVGFSARQPRIAGFLAEFARIQPTNTSEAEALFCLALHGLCLCLAGGESPRRKSESLEETERDIETAAADPDDAGKQDEDDYDPDEADDGADRIYRTRDLLSVPLARTEWIVADLLQRAVWKDRSGAEANGTATQAEPTIDHVRLVAKAALTCSVEALPEIFRIATIKTGAAGEDGGAGGPVRHYVTFPSALSGRIRELVRHFPYQLTLQPLKAAVQYEDSSVGTGGDGHRTYVPLIGYRRSNRLLRRFLAQALMGNDSGFDFRDYLRAINAQQAVAWRINAELAGHVRLLVELSRPREKWSSDLKGPVAALKRDELGELVEWIVDNFHRRGKQTRYEVAGEFLDHDLAEDALTDLTTPGEDGKSPAFFLPWKADYRGRIYAEAPWFTPQGGDVQRALFEFAAGHPARCGRHLRPAPARSKPRAPFAGAR